MTHDIAKIDNYSVYRQLGNNFFYYLPMNDPTFELSVFWPSDTESQINELRFSESISLSFKTRLTRLTAFAATLRQVN